MRPYNRSFVTLKQERSDYSSNERKALGRCIIEAKDGAGRISVYVQDLKPQTLYKLYIIACRSSRSTGVPLGTINVDAKGKGECKFEFDANNVGGSNLPIESFNVIAVIVPVKNDIIAPLVGYTDNVVIWKNNYWDYSLQEEILSDEALQEQEDVLEEEAPKEEILPVDDLIEGVLQEEVLTEEVLQEAISQKEDIPEAVFPLVESEETGEDPQNVDPIIQEVDTEQNNDRIKASESEEQREITLEAAHLAFRDIIYKFNEEIELLENYQYDFSETESVETSVQIQAAYDEVEDLDRMYLNHRMVTPFDRVFQDAEWIEISIKEIVFLDEKYFQYMYLPFVLDSYRRHSHLLLGRRQNEDKSQFKYILGVPSVFSEADSATANRVGFKHFIGCNGEDTEEGAFGYWMLYME